MCFSARFRWALSGFYGIVVLGKQTRANSQKELKMHTIQVTKTDGNWKIGLIDGIKFTTKVYEEPSEFGIRGGNVSKLWITGIAAYDRGWELRAKTSEQKAMVNDLLKYFKNPANCK